MPDNSVKNGAIVRVIKAPAAEWATDNIVLRKSQLGLETDTNKLKLGDGVTVWNSLDYVSGGSGGGGGGEDGDDGVGIASITKTETVGLVDTYTITYTDASTSTFTITNGAAGSDGTNGSNGLSAYQIAVNNGFSGSESAWLASLIGPAGALVDRSTVTKTTAPLANLAQESGTVTIAKGYRLLKLQVDKACRVRLYGTTTQRDADASRVIGEDPTGDHGLMFEYIATGAGTFTLSPLVDGASMETPAVTTIPILIQNRSGGTDTVSAIFTYQITE